MFTTAHYLRRQASTLIRAMYLLILFIHIVGNIFIQAALMAAVLTSTVAAGSLASFRYIVVFYLWRFLKTKFLHDQSGALPTTVSPDSMATQVNQTS